MFFAKHQAHGQMNQCAKKDAVLHSIFLKIAMHNISDINENLFSHIKESFEKAKQTWKILSEIL